MPKLIEVTFSNRDGERSKTLELPLGNQLYTCVPSEFLDELGIGSDEECDFADADGKAVKRCVSWVTVTINWDSAPSPVVFGEHGDTFAVGRLTLSELGLSIRDGELKRTPHLRRPRFVT